jgi:alkylation response protein AidB-like acyl-CoA dehydrogenase
MSQSSESSRITEGRASNLGPGSGAEAITVAEGIAAELAKTAVERDKQGGTPKRERDLLRQSKLLSLIVPKEYGGWGAGWPDTLRAVRIIARADGSLGHVFGFQHLLLATVRLFGSEAQWTELYSGTAARGWFWGNALNPLDRRTTIVESGPGRYRVDGTKSYTSGAIDAEKLVISASPPGESRLIVAVIPGDRQGIVLKHDWDNIGQRQTDSGSAEFHGVEVREEEILKTPGPLGSVFASLRPCIAQLILANVFLGIAEGAFAAARSFTKESARAWFTSGVASQAEDPYVLRHFGELYVELEAASLLADRAALELEHAYQLGDDLKPEQRGRVAIAVALAKVKATRSGLETASRIFETMGARATVRRLGFDRFWRNLRTHTLHDPVDYKLRELGEWALNEALPVPSFYS